MNRNHLSRLIVVVIVVFVILFGIKRLIFDDFSSNSSNGKSKLDNQFSSYLMSDNKVTTKAASDFYKLALERKDSLGLAYSFLFKSIANSKLKQQDSILYFLEKASVLNESFQDDYLAARIDYRYGVFYQLNNIHSMSLKHLLKAQHFFKNGNFEKEEAYSLNRIASLYKQLEDYDKSIIYYNKSGLLFDKLNDSLGKAIYNGNMSKVYIAKNEIAKAKEYAIYTNDAFLKFKDTANTISSLIDLSEIELKLNNTSGAIHYLDKAYDFAVNSKDTFSEAHVLIHYGTVFNYKNESAKALDYYNRGFQLSNNPYLVTVDYDVFKIMSSIYYNKGDFDNAYQNLHKYEKIRDSLNGANVLKKVKNQELEILSKEFEMTQEIDSQRNKFYMLVFLFSILGFVGIVSLIFIMYKNKAKSLSLSKLYNDKLKEKIETDKELKNIQKVYYELGVKAENDIKELKSKQFELENEAKNRKLTNINIQLLAKNNVLDEIELFMNSNKDMDIKLANDIKKIIRRNRNQEKEWNQYDELFSKVHPDFFEFIQKNYSQLSKTEVRICSFIKINMSNIEIANLLNISQASAHTSRYRIRKKLQLDRDEDLDKIIKSW